MSTQDYRELRVLIEDLVRTWPQTITSPAVEEARRYLRSHCHECGARLTVEQIAERQDLCARCFAQLFW